jgi:hypothetical protein
MSFQDSNTNLNPIIESQEPVASNKTAYLVFGLIVSFFIVFFVIYYIYKKVGIKDGYVRPVPSPESGLVAINGPFKELSPEEQLIFDEQIRTALNKIREKKLELN